jgi:hypothetical protein
LNIFFLADKLPECAQYHCDKHVVKMILEYTQILCTVLSVHGILTPYLPTHQKHPCTIWAGISLDNWSWLRSLTHELNKEYQYRFQRHISHKSAEVASKLPLPPIPSIGITERPQVMPNQYKVPGDPVTAYRKFYLNEKVHLLKYTRRPAPDWVLGV